MRFGLGLGMSGRINLQVSGGAPGDGETPIPPGDIIDDGGFQEPPIVVNVEDHIQFKGKKASGASGKFIYNIGVAEPGITYTMRYDPDWSGLANQGLTAMVGFGLKSGNDFHLGGLKGDGAGGLLAYEIYGTNKWNQTTGFTTVNGGAPANGTKDGPNWVRFAIAEDGSTYSLQTSADGEDWDTEISAVVPTPFSSAITPPVFGIAVFLEATDAGHFTVEIELWQTSITESDLWTPEELVGSGLALWLDADDASTFTFGTGTAVATWADKSGNGNDVTQGTAGSRPVRDAVTNTINGLAVVTFDGSDDFLTKSSISGFPADHVTPITMVCIARHRGDHNLQKALFDISDNTSTNRTGLAFLDGNEGINETALAARAGGENDASFSSQPYDETRVDLWSTNNGRTRRQAWRGGAPGTANNVDSGGSLAWTNIRIGRLFQDVFAFGEGDIGEMVFISGDDTTKRQLVEGYLAWKWGISGQLVSGHPYENAAPTL